MRAFLKRRPDFRMEPGPAPAHSSTNGGCLVVLPHETAPPGTTAEGGTWHGWRAQAFDGAFSARMEDPRMRRTGT